MASRVLRWLSRGLFMAWLCLAAGNRLQAVVIFDNFDSGGGFNGNSGTLVAARGFSVGGFFNGVRSAAQFSVSGGDFSLDSIVLPISEEIFGGGPTMLRVSIATNIASTTDPIFDTPGTILEVLSENEEIWPTEVLPFSTTTELFSTANPLLAEGESYWVVLEATMDPNTLDADDMTDYGWFVNTSGTTTLFRQQSTLSGLQPTGSWTLGATGPAQVAFRVNGSLVPEPSRVLLGGVAFLWIALSRRRAPGLKVPGVAAR